MPLAAVLVLVVVLIVVLILVVVVLVLVVILILVLVLIIHNPFLHVFFWVIPWLVCPVIQDLSFALKIKLTMKPAAIAAVIPPAVAFRPPVKIPRKFCSATASLTPFARV